MADPRDKVPPAAEPPVEPPQLALPRVPSTAKRTRSGKLVVENPGDAFDRYILDQMAPDPDRPRSTFDHVPGLRRRRP